MALKINMYDVILGPIMTDKAYKLNRKLQKLVLKVHPQANKPLVKKAIERLFDVKVETVRMLIRKLQLILFLFLIYIIIFMLIKGRMRGLLKTILMRSCMLGQII